MGLFKREPSVDQMRRDILDTMADPTMGPIYVHSLTPNGVREIMSDSILRPAFVALIVDLRRQYGDRSTGRVADLYAALHHHGHIPAGRA